VCGAVARIQKQIELSGPEEWAGGREAVARGHVMTMREVHGNNERGKGMGSS
jgi:hypothetical protein